MKEKIVKWLIEKSEEEKLTIDEQIEWLENNYKLNVNNKKEIEKFLSKNNYLTVAMNYLEMLKNTNIKEIYSKDLLAFIRLDGKINFLTLVYFWKIRTKIYQSLKEINLKNFNLKDNDDNFQDLLKLCQDLKESEIKDFCNEFKLEKQYFTSFITHIENIIFLKKDILDNNGTLFSMKDDSVSYSSLFEYVFFCIKYLLSEPESFKYKIHIQNNISNSEKINNVILNNYKKYFNFIEWTK